MQNLFTIAATLGSDGDNDGAGGHAANPEHSSASGRDRYYNWKLSEHEWREIFAFLASLGY